MEKSVGCPPQFYSHLRSETEEKIEKNREAEIQSLERTGAESEIPTFSLLLALIHVLA